MNSVANQFCARIAVAALERGIDIQETAVVERGNGERDRARSKDFLKFVIGNLAALFRLFERLFCLVEIVDPLLKFGPINRSALVETRVLDRYRGWDCQKLGTPQVFAGKAVRLRVPDRKKAQSAL